MDDLHIVEQRISREMLRRAGPSEPVDDLAVFEAVTAASDAPDHRWSVVSRLRRRLALASRPPTGSGEEQAIGGIKMLTSMRAAAVVAVLALSVSLVAVQVGSPTDTVTPGATDPGAAETAGAWVTVTGTQQVLSTVGGRGSLIGTMSDERLSGDIAITWSADAEGPSADENNDALWGATTIANDGGTWEGQWIGFVDDQGRHHIMSWLDGTGDYDGLRYVAQGTQREQGGLIDVTGLIYKGMAPSTVIPAEVVE